MSGPEVSRGIRPVGRIGAIVHASCRGAAYVGGAFLVSITLLTVISVVLRDVAGRPVPGDFELVEMGCAIAMFAFLPYCQLVGGNVAVEFVTARAPRWLRATLDAVGCAAYALIAALITWRLTLGGLDIERYRETTMVLGVPVWWAFVAIVPSVALLAVTAAYTTWRAIRRAAP
jgi:TRAP-type C4-dicarboxylate transport system permease small subunit